VFLVHHDPVIPGVGQVADLPAAAFANHRLANGEPLPTLEQALAALDGLEAWIEVKSLPVQWDGRFLEVLDRAPTPARCAVHGFDHRIIARLGERRAGLRRGVLLCSYLLDTIAAIRGTGAGTVWQEAPLIDRDFVNSLHSAGLEIIAWTVNHEARARELALLGVDGLCGNYPDRLLAAVGPPAAQA
jgi:glycerophosphoryl diester phosphodiesterase